MMRDGCAADTAVLAYLDNVSLAFNQPLPYRKRICAWLEPMSRKNTVWAIFLLGLDASLWVAALFLTAYLDSFFFKIVFGLIAEFITGRIFILGYDACHQSFTPHQGLNKFLGRLAFLPSLTPYSLWDVGHNVIHHG